MSIGVKCLICSREISTNSDESYFDGNDKYYCPKCGDDIIFKFNQLVNGSAGYTIRNDVSVSLYDIKKLMDMIERQQDMCRWVINDIKRMEVIKD